MKKRGQQAAFFRYGAWLWYKAASFADEPSSQTSVEPFQTAAR